MKLVLIRHAKAIDGFEFSGPDEERPLTKEGVSEFASITKCLERVYPKADVFFVSPYRRAQETSLELKKSISVLHEYTLDDITPESSPEDSIRSMKRYLNELSSHEAVFLIGHEPHIGSLAALLITGSYQPVIHPRRGSVHCIRFDGDIRPGAGVLEFSIYPNLLNHQ